MKALKLDGEKVSDGVLYSLGFLKPRRIYKNKFPIFFADKWHACKLAVQTRVSPTDKRERCQCSGG